MNLQDLSRRGRAYSKNSTAYITSANDRSIKQGTSDRARSDNVEISAAFEWDSLSTAARTQRIHTSTTTLGQ